MTGPVKLPSCRTQAPECGACRGETFYDGSDFICDECGLFYGDGFDGTTAVYIDTGTPPCCAPCSNAWHSSPRHRPVRLHPVPTPRRPQGRSLDRVPPIPEGDPMTPICAVDTERASHAG